MQSSIAFIALIVALMCALFCSLILAVMILSTLVISQEDEAMFYANLKHRQNQWKQAGLTSLEDLQPEEFFVLSQGVDVSSLGWDLRQNMKTPLMLFSILVQVVVCVLTFVILCLDTDAELWLYLKPRSKARGFFDTDAVKKLKIAAGLMGAFTLWQTLGWLQSATEKHIFTTNLITFFLLSALVFNAVSKVADFTFRDEDSDSSEREQEEKDVDRYLD